MRTLALRKKIIFAFFVACVFLLADILWARAGLSSRQLLPNDVKAAGGTTWYVSKSGNNTNGLSWDTAWNELNRIRWSEIRPGDTILLDGGPSQMIYTTPLTVGKSGLPGQPILIKRATEPGHNGTVILFGGRSIPLPYCGQRTYTYQTRGVLSDGIVVGDNAYDVIDGSSWHGIRIYGDNGSGIVFGANSHNDTIRNIEIEDDGTASQGSDDAWHPFGPYGVNLLGANQTFQSMDIHDDGEDAFQPTNINNITVQWSWLHDSRPNPVYPGSAFNQCNHNDGMQIWTGNPVSTLTFEDDIFGPVKENGLILGNGLVPVRNVNISDSLFIDANSNDIWGSPAANWTIDHITSYAQNQNLILDGSGHTVTNSIFYGGLMSFHGSIASSANNCQWQTIGDNLNGRTVNPQFVSNLSPFPRIGGTDLRQGPAISTLTGLDFALEPSSPCKGLGSSITSVASFLQLVGSVTPTPTPKPVPTSTPTAAPTRNPTPTLIVIVGSAGHKNTPEHKKQGPTHSEAFLWLLLAVLIAAIVLLLIVIAKRRKRRHWKQ
jgi:hypothetical protein